MNKIILSCIVIVFFCVVFFFSDSYDLRKILNKQENPESVDTIFLTKPTVTEDMNNEIFVKNEDEFHYFSLQKDELPYTLSKLDAKYRLGIGHMWFGHNYDLESEHHSNEHQKGYVIVLTPIINDLMYSNNIEFDQDKFIDNDIVNEIHNPVFDEARSVSVKQSDLESASANISIIKNNEIDFCFESITKIGKVVISSENINLEIIKDNSILSKEYIKDSSLFELIKSDKCHAKFGGKFLDYPN